MEEIEVFVNIKMPVELREKLDEMAEQDDSDRSKLIRNLIRQEYERRNPPHDIKRKTQPRIRPVYVAA